MISFIIDYAEAAEDLAEEEKRKKQKAAGGMKTFKGHQRKRR